MDYSNLIVLLIGLAIVYGIMLLCIPFYIYRIRSEAIEMNKLLFDIRGHLQAISKVEGSFYDRALKIGHTKKYTQNEKAYFPKPAKAL